VVTGVGRSGTSAMAQALHTLGVQMMGADCKHRHEVYNADGYWEDPAMNELCVMLHQRCSKVKTGDEPVCPRCGHNRGIQTKARPGPVWAWECNACGTVFDGPAGEASLRVRTPRANWRPFREYVEGQRALPVWGVKDPRFVFWLPWLLYELKQEPREVYVIKMVRPEAEQIRSWEFCGAGTAEDVRGQREWLEKTTEGLQNIRVVDFRVLRKEAARVLEGLAKWIGLPVEAGILVAAAKTVKPELVHFKE